MFKITFRSWQGSNLRGQCPLDFKSNALTTRPQLLVTLWTHGKLTRSQWFIGLLLTGKLLDSSKEPHLAAKVSFCFLPSNSPHALPATLLCMPPPSLLGCPSPMRQLRAPGSACHSQNSL